MESRIGFRLYPVSVSVYSTFGDFGIYFPGKQAACLHAAQMTGQHFLCDPCYRAHQFIKSFRSRHQISDNEYLPFISDELQRHLYRAVRDFFIGFMRPPPRVYIDTLVFQSMYG